MWWSLNHLMTHQLYQGWWFCQLIISKVLLTKPPYDPTIISKSIGRPTICIESLTDQDVQVAWLIDGVSNNGPSVCGWNSSSSSGNIPIKMDGLTLEEDNVGISSMNKALTFDWKIDVEHYISKMNYKSFFKKDDL